MRRAFTLIELLVVIAIIAILAAILFPVFAQAKAAAKKTACMSNAKQIGVSLYLYLSDSDDTLPMANYPAPPAYMGPPWTQFAFHNGAGVSELAWADLMMPYTKNIDIFKCSVDNSGGPGGVPGKPLCYGLNYYFYRQPNGVARFSLTGGNLSELANTSQKIFICETASNSGREILRPDRFGGFERHAQGSMWVMADTHAKFHTMPQWWKTIPSATWGLPENAMLQPCPQWFPWLDETSEQW